MSTWKNVEREVAARLGGERIPVSGRQRGDAPDISHDWLSIEVKHRKSAVPKWQLEGMKQAEASVRGNQLPILIIHAKGQRFDDCLVQLRLSDFVEWFGK